MKIVSVDDPDKLDGVLKARYAEYAAALGETSAPNPTAPAG